MSSVLVQISKNPVTSTRVCRGGLLVIGYDKDGDVVWFDAVDPISIAGNLPKRDERTDEQSFEEFLAEVTPKFGEFTQEQIDQMRIDHKALSVRLTKSHTPELDASLERVFKEKVKIRLREKFDSDMSLLNGN